MLFIFIFSVQFISNSLYFFISSAGPLLVLALMSSKYGSSSSDDGSSVSLRSHSCEFDGALRDLLVFDPFRSALYTSLLHSHDANINALRESNTRMFNTLISTPSILTRILYYLCTHNDINTSNYLSYTAHVERYVKGVLSAETDSDETSSEHSLNAEEPPSLVILPSNQHSFRDVLSLSHVNKCTRDVFKNRVNIFDTHDAQKEHGNITLPVLSLQTFLNSHFSLLFSPAQSAAPSLSPRSFFAYLLRLIQINNNKEDNNNNNNVLLSQMVLPEAVQVTPTLKGMSSILKSTPQRCESILFPHAFADSDTNTRYLDTLHTQNINNNNNNNITSETEEYISPYEYHTAEEALTSFLNSSFVQSLEKNTLRRAALSTYPYDTDSTLKTLMERQKTLQTLSFQTLSTHNFTLWRESNFPLLLTHAFSLDTHTHTIAYEDVKETSSNDEEENVLYPADVACFRGVSGDDVAEDEEDNAHAAITSLSALYDAYREKYYHTHYPTENIHTDTDSVQNDISAPALSDSILEHRKNPKDVFLPSLSSLVFDTPLSLPASTLYYLLNSLTHTQLHTLSLTYPLSILTQHNHKL